MASRAESSVSTFLPIPAGVEQQAGRISVRFFDEKGEIEFTPAALPVAGRLGVSETIFGDDFSFLRQTVTLCLSPQCGFSSTVEGNRLSYEDEVAKLRLVVETSAEVWGR